MIKLNAKNEILGRLAARVAKLLIQGEEVQVTDIEGIKQTTRKKIYHHHTLYPGGIKEKTYEEVGPEWAFRHAVRGMLPVNKLRKNRLKNMTILTNKKNDKAK